MKISVLPALALAGLSLPALAVPTWEETLRTLCSYSKMQKVPGGKIQEAIETQLPAVESVEALNELFFGSERLAYPTLWRLVRADILPQMNPYEVNRRDWYIEAFFAKLLDLHRRNRVTDRQFVETVRRFAMLESDKPDAPTHPYFASLVYGYTPVLQEATKAHADQAIASVAEGPARLLRVAQWVREVRVFFVALRDRMGRGQGGTFVEQFYGPELPSLREPMPIALRRHLWGRHVRPLLERFALPETALGRDRSPLMELLRLYAFDEDDIADVVRRCLLRNWQRLPQALELLHESIRAIGEWYRPRAVVAVLDETATEVPFDVVTHLLADLASPARAYELLDSTDAPYFRTGLTMEQLRELLAVTGKLPVLWSNAVIDDFLARSARYPLSRADADVLTRIAATAVLTDAAASDLRERLATAPPPAAEVTANVPCVDALTKTPEPPKRPGFFRDWWRVLTDS